MNFKDRVVVVTGVSRPGQIGQAVALAFARAGARLVLAARTAQNVEDRARECRELGAEAVGVAADLSTEEGAAALAAEVRRRFGAPQVLVNLAGGLTVYKPAVDHTPADWQAELNNNLTTAFLTSRAIFPLMREGGGGSIINFSRAGLPQANMLAYNCAKAGVEALTRTLALEGRDFNIRVNAVGPGLTDTEQNLRQMKPKDTSRWAGKEDIARTVLFLASDEAAGITGQVIAVAGKGI